MTDTSDADKAAADKLLSLFQMWEKTGLAAWSWTNPRWYRQATTVNAELLRFACDRLQKDMTFQKEALKCRNPAELQDLQGKFLREAFEQYSAETSRLIRMNSDALEAIAGSGVAGNSSSATRKPRRTREGRLPQRVRT